MQRIVLTFGLIAGGILSLMMVITLPFHEQIGNDRGEIIGYTSMVVAFLLVYFGVRAYRDTVAKGSITFGRAFRVGALIALIASTCYVATWQVLYFGFIGDEFTASYQSEMLAQARADGATEVELAARQEELAKFASWYRNPFFNAAITFIEPLPLGLLFALVSAGILRRKEGGSGLDVSAGLSKTDPSLRSG